MGPHEYALHWSNGKGFQHTTTFHIDVIEDSRPGWINTLVSMELDGVPVGTSPDSPPGPTRFIFFNNTFELYSYVLLEPAFRAAGVTQEQLAAQVAGTVQVTYAEDGQSGETEKIDLRMLAIQNLRTEPGELEPNAPLPANLTVKADLVALPAPGDSQLFPEGWKPTQATTYQVSVKDSNHALQRKILGNATMSDPDASGRVGGINETWNGRDENGNLLNGGQFRLAAAAVAPVHYYVYPANTATNVSPQGSKVRIQGLAADPPTLDSGETTNITAEVRVGDVLDPSGQYTMTIRSRPADGTPPFVKTFTGDLTFRVDLAAVDAAWDGQDDNHQAFPDGECDLELTVTVTGSEGTASANATMTVTVGGAGDVTVKPEEFEPEGNETTTLTTHFSGAGLTVESVIRSETGEVVKTYPAQPSDGAVSLVWDGRSDAGALEYGEFTWEVTGKSQGQDTRRSATVSSIPSPPDLVHIDGVETLDLADAGGPLSKVYFDKDSNTDGHIAMSAADVSGSGPVLIPELIKARGGAGTNVTYLNMMFRRRPDSPANLKHAIEYLYEIRGPRPSGTPAPTKDDPDPSPKGDTLANVSVTFGPGDQILVQGLDFEDKKIRLHLPPSVQIIYRLDFWARTKKQEKYKLRYTVPSSKRSSDGTLIETGSGNISVTLREPVAPWDDQKVDPHILLRACKYATGARTDLDVQTGTQHQTAAQVGLNHNLYMWLTWKGSWGYNDNSNHVKHTAPGQAIFDLSSFMDAGGDAESTCAFAQIHYAALGVSMRTAELDLGNRVTLPDGRPGLVPLRSLWIRPWFTGLLSTPGGDSDFPVDMTVPLWSGPVPARPNPLSTIPVDLTSLRHRPNLYGDSIPLVGDPDSNWQFLAFLRHYINIEATDTGAGFEATFATFQSGLVHGTKSGDFGELLMDQMPGTPPQSFADLPFTVTEVK